MTNRRSGRAAARPAAQTGEAVVTITAMGHRGEGVAEFEDTRLFVPYTLPGERVRIARTSNRGRPLAILDPSPDRIEPVCPHFGACGGCQLQHWQREEYRAFKQGLVAEALAQKGLTPKIAPLAMAHGEGRRRASLHATEKGAGYTQLRGHDIVALDRCPILVPALADAPAISTAIARALGPCDVALTATDTGLDVAIRGKKLRAADLAPLARTHDLARIAVNGEVRVQRRPVRQTVGPAIVDLPSGGFLQATDAAETQLAERALSALGPAKRVADLFSGVGPFALRIARAAKIYAVDSDRAAIAALDAALQATPGLKRLGTATRDLFHDPLVPAELDRFDALVFDPPRAGAEAQARELARSRLKTIVAVACDPQSFARDAAILVAGGYTLEWVAPLDQFLYSAHVELVARFRR